MKFNNVYLKYGSSVVSDFPPGSVGNNKEVADNIFILIRPVKGISFFLSSHYHQLAKHAKKNQIANGLVVE